MKPKTIILLCVGGSVGVMGIAVACGLVASYIASRLIAKKQATVFVFKAKQDYGQWTLVKEPEEMFKPVEIYQTEAPKNIITAWDPNNPPAEEKMAAVYDSLRNRPLFNNLRQGDILTQTDLLSAIKSGLADQLPSGKRAMSIPITTESSVAGFIQPGTRVDILLTKRRAGQKPESEYILQNILVRALEREHSKTDKPGLVGSVVTLELDPKEAMILMTKMDSGKITLTLRPFGDKKNPPPPLPPDK